MSLVVLQNATNVAPGGVSVPFGATGGSEPYLYSVAPGGAGGSIDVDGTYTSPENPLAVGVDTILVSDSSSPAALTASATIVVNQPLALVADLIKTGLGLSRDQVYLFDQKFNVPNDSRLYVAIGVQSCRPFGNRPRYDGGGSAEAALTAVQSVNMLATISLDVLSRSTEALYRKEQVLLALTSPYAQRQMALNSFFVAPLSTGFVNLSLVEGPAIPYRFQILVSLQYFTRLAGPTEYFDQFGSVEVVTEP